MLSVLGETNLERQRPVALCYFGAALRPAEARGLEVGGL